MAKKLDAATKLLIDSLPENLQKLATNAIEVGYLSQMDFNAATEADEVPTDEQDEVLDFFNKIWGWKSWKQTILPKIWKNTMTTILTNRWTKPVIC